MFNWSRRERKNTAEAICNEIRAKKSPQTNKILTCKKAH